MAEGENQSPAISLPDVYACGLPYPPVDTLVEDFADVNSSMATIDVPDPLEYTDTHHYPCGTNGPCVPHRLPMDQMDRKNFVVVCKPCFKMALGETPCPHGLFPRDPREHLFFDRSSGWSSQAGVTNPSPSPAPASGLVMPHSVPNDSSDFYGWGLGVDHSAPQTSERHHVKTASITPAASVSPVKTTVSLGSHSSAASPDRVGDHNVPTQRWVPQFGRRPPRFQQPGVSPSTAPQVQAASRPVAQGGSPTGEVTHSPNSMISTVYIEPYNSSIRTWYVVTIGRRVGVFASAPFYARSSKRASPYRFFYTNDHDEAVSQFWQAQRRGQVWVCP